MNFTATYFIHTSFQNFFIQPSILNYLYQPSFRVYLELCVGASMQLTRLNVKHQTYRVVEVRVRERIL